MFCLLMPCLRLLLLLFSLLISTATAPTLPPFEAKRDQLMEKRFRDSLAALREKDDAKTVRLLEAMATTFIEEMQKLKPHYQAWYQSLSAEEKQRLLYQDGPKKWRQLIEEIHADAAIQLRFSTDLKLKQEYERIQFLCDKAADLGG